MTSPSRLRRREELAHVIEEARVSREIRSGCPADRSLVHAHQAPHAFHSRNDLAAFRDDALLQRIVLFLLGIELVPEMLRHELDEHLADQRGLARTRDTGDA